MAVALEVRVLGPFEVLRDGRPLVLTSNRLRALLSVLATSAGEFVSVETLAATVWGSALPANPRSSLQTYIARLRHLLGGDTILTRPGGYQFDLDTERVDALRFRRLVAVRRGSAGERAELVEALRLWRGTPFDGVESDWLAQSEGARLTEAYLDALERAADLDLAAGRAGELLDEMRAASERHPLREPLCVQLMLALDATGRRADALAHYEEFRATLAHDLGTDPGPRLRAVRAGLLTPGAQAGDVPRQLPSDIARFTGRSDVLRALDRLTAVGDVVGVLHGTGGVGKTAAVVHWAHRVGDLFPGGQLFVDLHGYGPGAPVPPAVALDGVLRALGVDGHKIPDRVDGRVAMLRKLLTGRRTLLVLDNARDADQVRPLLPGGPNVAVVTSRSRLRGLSGEHQVRRIRVDELSRAEATEFLARALRSAHDVRELNGLAELCGRLPLALAVAAEYAGRYPRDELGRVVAELRDRRDRLDALEEADDPASSVRTVFSWSLGTLPPDRVRAFQLLGLHPGPDLDAPAAAAMIGTTTSRARRLLGTLVDAHLLEQRRPGRYQFHDLLRAYAVELTGSLDDEEREAALRRLLTWYVHTTANARVAIGRGRSLGETGPLPSELTPLEFAGSDEAFAWLDAQRAGLVAAVELAADVGHDAAYRLAEQMSSHLIVRYALDDLMRTQTIALEAARRAGDTFGEAVAASKLGSVYRMVGDYERARDLQLQALAQFEALGNDYGRCVAMANLGTALQALGDEYGALDSQEQGLELARRVGDHDQVVLLLNNLAMSYLRLQRYDDAVDACREALRLPRSPMFKHAEPHMLDSLGQALTASGQYDEAIDAYRRSLLQVRELGDPWGESIVLSNLGTALRVAGRLDEAAASWRQALTVMDENGIADGHEVSRDRLHEQLEELDPQRAQA